MSSGPHYILEPHLPYTLVKLKKDWLYISAKRINTVTVKVCPTKLTQMTAAEQ